MSRLKKIDNIFISNLINKFFTNRLTTLDKIKWKVSALETTQ
jgi:hypothetical protein